MCILAEGIADAQLIGTEPFFTCLCATHDVSGPALWATTACAT